MVLFPGDHQRIDPITVAPRGVRIAWHPAAKLFIKQHLALGTYDPGRANTVFIEHDIMSAARASDLPLIGPGLAEHRFQMVVDQFRRTAQDCAASFRVGESLFQHGQVAGGNVLEFVNQ